MKIYEVGKALKTIGKGHPYVARILLGLQQLVCKCIYMHINSAFPNVSPLCILIVMLLTLFITSQEII